MLQKSHSSPGRRLRVLHVTEASCAGVGGHVLDLAEGLCRRECECHLLYSPRRMDGVFEQRVAESTQLASKSVWMQRWPHWSDWSAWRMIRRYARHHGPFDIIHAHSTKAGGLTRLFRPADGAAVVYTPNGVFTMNPAAGVITRFIARTIERRLAKRTTAVIAVSPEEHEHMQGLGFPPDRLTMIPNGLGRVQWKDRDALRRQFGFADNELVFGFLGRLASQKNPLLLVEAFARVRHASARLAVVGTGPLEDEALSLAHRLGIADRIRWLGFQTAAGSMPAFDVFVLPSRYEGMPYVLMEAVSARLPVIATRVGGATLCVEHDRNGLLVDSGNSEQLAQALQQIADDSDLRLRFAAAALQKRREFSLDRMVDATLDLYCKLRNDRRTAAGRSVKTSIS